MRIPKLAGKLSLAVASVLLCTAALEVVFRIHESSQRRKASQEHIVDGEPLQILIDSPALYGLNPKHPEVSTQGLRNDEVTIPKPDGVWRILILGDSVTYGTRVPRERAYPHRLEAYLAKRVDQVEVINAGVSGYSPYNELQYYLADGRHFEPDIVVVQFCMNDVANPRVHWGYPNEFVKEVPEAAIPNKEKDRSLQRERSSLLNRSALYRVLEAKVTRVSGFEPDESGFYTFITGEDHELGIDVLVDTSSPEFQWLTSTYDEMHAAVTSDGAAFVVAVFPLSYQLDPAYPYSPQDNLAEYCRSRSIPCIDLLPRFRESPLGGYFRDNIAGLRDAWHLSERGHRFTAQVLGERLLEMR